MLMYGARAHARTRTHARARMHNSVCTCTSIQIDTPTHLHLRMRSAPVSTPIPRISTPSSVIRVYSCAAGHSSHHSFVLTAHTSWHVYTIMRSHHLCLFAKLAQGMAVVMHVRRHTTCASRSHADVTRFTFLQRTWTASVVFLTASHDIAWVWTTHSPPPPTSA
jgi:hypothetical protein